MIEKKERGKITDYEGRALERSILDIESYNKLMDSELLSKFIQPHRLYDLYFRYILRPDLIKYVE